MEAHEDHELVVIMARLAEGGRARDAAIVTLYDRFGGAIGGMVRRLARERGAHFDREELDGVVFDCCDELARVAKAWSPDGGALPWVWAHKRMADVVGKAVGQHADPVDELPPGALEQHLADAPAPARCDDDPPLSDTLDAMAPDHKGLRHVLEAFERSGVSARDREVLLHHAHECQAGNASPAVTLAEVFGMTAANVRQVVRRTKLKLQALAATDPQFALLADLPLLA